MTNVPNNDDDPLLIEAEKSFYSLIVPANASIEEEIIGAIALSKYWRSKHNYAEKHFKEFQFPVRACDLRVQLSATFEKETIDDSKKILQGYVEKINNQQLVDSIEKIVEKNTNPWKAGGVNIVSTFIFSLLALAFLLTPFSDNLKDAYKVLIKEAVIVKPAVPQNK